MHHQEFEPPEELQDVIKCFWYNKREFGEEQTSFDVMPDGYAELIFYFGSDLSVSYNGIQQPLSSPFMMGLLNQPAVFFTKGRFEIIGIRCFPWTVFDLLDLPSDQNGVRIATHPIAQLQSALDNWVKTGNINEALTEVGQYFQQARIATDSMLFKAGKAMRAASGNLPVSQVAEAAHATVRTLERKFRQSSGHTVKDVSGLIRFEQVRNQLWNNPDTHLAGLAYELGYTDQSHLSREFKRYSGTTPAAFARHTKKGKLAMSSYFVAFVQA